MLMFLFIFIYSLLGMELFSNQAKFNEDDELDLKNGEFVCANFNDFGTAAISVFIVLANDGWSVIYLNHYRSSGGLKSTIFFISLIIVGQYMILNLLLAIMLRSFDE